MVSGTKKRKKRKRNRNKAATAATYTPPKPPQKESGARVVLAVAGFVGWIALFPLFWLLIAPALSDAVGTVPVVNTIVGWLPGGLAMVVIGLVVLAWDDIPLARRPRWTAVAFAAGALGSITFPGLDTEPMYVEYIAGVYAGFLSMLAWIPAFGVVALARRPFTHSWSLSMAWRGRAIIGAAVVMLFLGAGVMRTWF